MTLKREVVSELGDDELLKPELIAKSLVADDQVKYYFALLQTARANAEFPQIPPPDLKVERTACGIGEDWLDKVVAGTLKDDSGGYRVPQGPRAFTNCESRFAGRARLSRSFDAMRPWRSTFG